MNAEAAPFTPKGVTQTQVPASESSKEIRSKISQGRKNSPQHGSAAKDTSSGSRGFTGPVPTEENSSSRENAGAAQETYDSPPHRIKRLARPIRVYRGFHQPAPRFRHRSPRRGLIVRSRQLRNNHRRRLLNCLRRKSGKRTWTNSGLTHCNPQMTMLPPACSLTGSKTLKSCGPLWSGKDH